MRKSNQTTMQSEIFIVLMIVAILLFIIASITLTNIEKEKGKLEEEKIVLEDQKRSLQELLKEYYIDKDEAEKLKEIIDEMKKHRQPPLITLDEANGYSFDSGLASLSDEFQENLKKIIRKIKLYANQYSCDTIEVYGYTDGQSFSTTNGTAKLDNALHLCLSDNGCEINKIKPSSNLELGMQRAISVVSFLTSNLYNDSKIRVIRPYSGGQFIDSYGKIADVNDTLDNSTRRRIEIKLSRSKDFK